jgi:DNA-directed RNA polymerase
MSLDCEIEREKVMAQRGESRARTMINKALERGDGGMTPAGLRLAKQGILPMANGIRAFLLDAASGKPGRRHVAARLLKGVDPELASFICIRVVLSSASKRYALKSTAITVGDRLEAEIMADKFEVANEALFRAVMRNAAARGLAPERAAKSVALANEHAQVVEKEWTQRDRLLVGTKLIEIMIETIGIVQTALVTQNKRKSHKIQLRPEVAEWFERYNNASMLSRPLFLPTVVRPKPWTDPNDGAYFSPVMGRAKIVSRPFPGQVEALRAASMGTVYGAINALQDTPWRINKSVLEVMRQAWTMDAGLTCLPRREDEPIPVTPQEVQDAEKGSQIRKEWRAKVRTIYERNAKGRSARFEMGRALAIAHENEDLEAIYFPHRLDFRGRAYAASTSLNPQGSDEVRGLLEFAEGKPLGERGVFWLGVHGANLFGNDKVSLDDRAKWAWDHITDAMAVVADPLANLWWTEADKPWAFLGWCFEWGRMIPGRPELFHSRLPVALDGSCNGIQHFSAMLRDPVGGAAVNLVPSPKPQDIYQEVANRAIERLEEMSAVDDEDAWIADGWLAFGINRKTTKRAVMVLPYGGTFKSCLGYVREAVRERIDAGVLNPFGDELLRAEVKLAAIIWSSIGDVVVAARTAMSWLQACARVATKAGVPLRWTTPSGFVVCQQYRELKGKRIKTHFCGNLISFGSLEEKDVLDTAKQCSAVSPNFVHSMDAAAMMRTIVSAKESGITSFAMIHDSYGTHAADTDRLAFTLRDEFASMYLRYDVLGSFRDELAAVLPPKFAAELPPLPDQGSLDLRQVLDSQYFFA